MFSSRSDVALLQRVDRCAGRVADAVLGEGDRARRACLRQRLGDRLQAISGSSRALGPAEMRQQDDLAPPLSRESPAMVGSDALDAGVASVTPAVLHRER